MKKKILSFAIISMSLLSFSAMAQSNNPEAAPKVENAKAKKANRPQHKSIFDGLNLTDAQKSQLQQLDEKCKETHKEQAQALREERRHNDSIRMEQRREDQKKYLAEVKSILGPEKYISFLENMYINGKMNKRPQMGKMAMQQNKNLKAKNNRRHGKATASKSAKRPAKQANKVQPTTSANS